ncbi:MAG: glycosyltransferase [Clostridia bacterium]|nr:glycosyltransferase [Clostridia bacterium]
MISIIINVYNGEKYIKKCLDCIINQTYKDMEILIVNDGSTDNTLSICEEYRLKDERIRIITTENKGLALSRNDGIENSKGEYLYFVDVDDWIELDTIEYLYNLCEKNNTPMAMCGYIEVYDYNVHIQRQKENIKIISSKEMLDMILLWKNNRAAVLWNKLIRRELFDNLRFEKRPTNDITLTYKLVMKIDRIAYSNQIKYYYLRHGESITTEKREDLIRSIDIYNASLERYYYIKNIYPNLESNTLGLLCNIERLYLRKNEEIINYLNNNGVIELFNKLFSFKLLFCKMDWREKFKLILFRINPKLQKSIINIYLKIKRKIK